MYDKYSVESILVERVYTLRLCVLLFGLEKKIGSDQNGHGAVSPFLATPYVF